MALTPRENFLNALNHKPVEWAPLEIVDCIGLGFGVTPGPWFEKGPMGGGYDGFGVRWINPSTGGGAPIPAPNEFLLDSETVVDWKKILKFPDLEAVDWEQMVAMELEIVPFDRNLQAVEFGCGNGVFERLAALMGFEEALIAMAEEPEAVAELLEAITDYKIEFAKKVKQYYNPDIFVNYDDIATERGPFMSPATYRQLIKPQHKRLNDAVKELGMIPVQHTCGYCEPLVEDIIDTGAAAWTSVQPTNDIKGILEKYGDQLVLMGGFDSNGPPSLPTATWDMIKDEVHRCFDEYGQLKGYVFFGFLLVDTLDPAEAFAKMGPMLQEAAGYSHQKGSK